MVETAPISGEPYIACWAAMSAAAPCAGLLGVEVPIYFINWALDLGDVTWALDLGDVTWAT